jgi:predicted HTH transcriptional regulator
LGNEQRYVLVLWEENDLLDIVKIETQESIELDFKESKALENTEKKKDDISKDVSAFANSAGGTIIYGMIGAHVNFSEYI